MLGFVVYLMLSILVMVGGLAASHAIGRKRFYLSGDEIRQSRYDGWVVEAFACLVAASFFILFLCSLWYIIYYGTFRQQDNYLSVTVVPFVALMAFGLYRSIVIICRRSELSYRQLRIRSVGKKRSSSLMKKTISWEELQEIIRQGQEFQNETDWLELIDVSERPGLIRALRIAAPYDPASHRKLECAPLEHHPGWGVVRPAPKDCCSVVVTDEGSMPDEKAIPETSPETPSAPLPQPISWKEVLEPLLEPLSEGDRELVWKFFSQHPEYKELATSQESSLRLRIRAATEHNPRRVVINVQTFAHRGRVKTL